MRYAQNWGEISKRCRQRVNYRCCYSGCDERAIETHHAAYSDERGAIAGREIGGIHVFPLCRIHHSRRHKEGAHHRRNWKHDFDNPVLGSGNSEKYLLKLRDGWISKINI